jgi:small-conductance mechanosensitive channel
MLLLLVQIGLGGLAGTATFFGLLTAGLAIALRDPIVSLIGWVFILVSRPFAIGDRIQIGTVAGDVVDLRLFQFTLLEIGNWVAADQSTGRVLHLPNSRVFSETIANYTAGYRYIWNELPLILTVDSDWRRALTLLQTIAERHALEASAAAEEEVRAATRKFMIQYNRLTPTVYLDLDPLGVRLTVRYLCEPRQRRTSADALWRDILTTLAAEPTLHLVQGALLSGESDGATGGDGV